MIRVSLIKSAGSVGAQQAPSRSLKNVVLQTGLPISGLQLAVSGSNQHLPPSCSLSHPALKCSESQLAKAFSRITPIMAASIHSAIPKLTTRLSSSSTNSARQRKFHRHFSEVPADEQVLNYYSCALVADILLQGQLYITPNSFGFYSNIFGYVTKLLIPTESVLKISKEKTVRIIPNAIAVVTEEHRHVFCSLLSRDSTFELMKQVWDAVKKPPPAIDLPISVEGKLCVGDSGANLEEDDSSMMSGSGTDCTSRLSTECTDTDGFSASISRPADSVADISRKDFSPATRSFRAAPSVWVGLRPSTLIAILVVLLAALYVSAALVMFRIDRLQTAYSNHPRASPEHSTQDRLLQYLNSNLDQIGKIRQNLQALSQQFLLMTEGADKKSGVSDSLIDPEDAPS